MTKRNTSGLLIKNSFVKIWMFKLLNVDIFGPRSSQNTKRWSTKSKWLRRVSLKWLSCIYMHKWSVLFIESRVFFAELLEDGFGNTPFYHCIITEIQGENSSDGRKPPLYKRKNKHAVVKNLKMISLDQNWQCSLKKHCVLHCTHKQKRKNSFWLLHKIVCHLQQ